MSKAMKETESAPQMMTLTELAQLSDISKSTIHNYMKMGLLHSPQKKGFNLSIYDYTHLNKIRHIRDLRKNQKLHLSKIKEILSQEEYHLSGAFDEEKAASLIYELKEKKRETRAQKNKMKRIEILDAAIALFTQNGYENTTLEAIAESLHIAKSTIYLYFENKEDLFLDCIERMTLIAVPEDAWDEIRKEQDPNLRFKKRALAFHKAFPSFNGILTLTRAMLGNKNQKLSEKAKKTLILMTRPIAKDLRRGIVKGVFRDIDEELLAHMVLAMGEGLGCRLMMDSQYTIEDGLAAMFDLISQGISTREQGNPGLSSGDVIDINGVKTRVRDICFGETGFIPARSGLAEVQIDPKKVAGIKIMKNGSSFQAELTSKDGKSYMVEVDGRVLLEGDTPVGRFSIQLNSIRSVSF